MCMRREAWADGRPSRPLSHYRRFLRRRRALSTVPVMDNKPAGPRQPPDKRNAAYESIFGRPGGMHHPSTLPSQTNYGQQQNSYVGNGSTSQQFPQQYLQQYPPPQQGRPPSFTDYGHPPLNTSYSSQPQGFHRAPTQANQPQYPYQNVQYPYQNNQQTSLSPPQTISRARSMNSVPYSSQPVHLVQESDPSLDKYTRAGLTPAQAYQQQVYMTGGHQLAGTNPNRRSYHSSHNSISGTPAYSQNGTIPDIPRVNLDLNADGNLGLNFDTEGASPSTAVSSSELPWASAETPGACIAIVLGKGDGEPMFLQSQHHNGHLQVACIPKLPPTTIILCLCPPVPILSSSTRL